MSMAERDEPEVIVRSHVEIDPPVYTGDLPSIIWTNMQNFSEKEALVSTDNTCVSCSMLLGGIQYSDI